jgi:hypothetical protein
MAALWWAFAYPIAGLENKFINDYQSIEIFIQLRISTGVAKIV